MNILLTGASGFIGKALYQRLRQCGHHLLACVHQAKADMFDAETELIVCDFSRDTDISTWLPRLQQVDVVVNAVGIFQPQTSTDFERIHTQAPIALFAAAAQVGVKRIVQISALGADEQAQSPYHLSKYAADQALMQQDLDWYIVRPSLVYGEGGHSFTLFNALAAMPVQLLPGGGSQRIQPIHIEDLSRPLVACVEGKVSAKQIINAVGAESVSLRDYLSLLRQHLGLGRLRFIAVPLWLSMALAWLAELFQHSLLSRESLRMLQRGSTADVSEFSRLFSFQPLSLQQALAQYPPSMATQQFCRLYWLRPLLRLSIAITWISAGWVSAFGYPVAQSYALLADMGIADALAPLLLYGAAALDCALGLALFSQRWLAPAIYLQITTMLLYTLLISWFLPAFWLDPFGSVVKNLPLLVASLVLLQLEKNRS